MHSMKNKKRKRNRKKLDWKKLLIIAVLVLTVVMIGLYFFMKYRTYDYVEIVETYENNSTDNANYMHCLEGILRYSRDGVALLTVEGEEVWNQSCQMRTPVVEHCGDSIAVGDKGGTSIYIFQEDGLLGEIQTAKPIEKFDVSTEGVVCALLKDEDVPVIMCYDAKGEELLGKEVSLSSMGYPVDVAIYKEKGKSELTILVSHLYTQENVITTNIAYYHFESGNNEDSEHLIKQETLSNTLVPSVAFMEDDISLLVADNSLVFYEDAKEPKKRANVVLKNEIQSVAYDDEIVAVLLKGNDTTNYILQIFDTEGDQLAAVDVDSSYSNMKVIDGQIVMYEGQLCSIYMKNGVQKFKGNVEESIMDIFPLGGLNKYMMINASGFHQIKLVN